MPQEKPLLADSAVLVSEASGLDASCACFGQ